MDTENRMEAYDLISQLDSAHLRQLLDYLQFLADTPEPVDTEPHQDPE